MTKEIDDLTERIELARKIRDSYRKGPDSDNSRTAYAECDRYLCDLETERARLVLKLPA